MPQELRADPATLASRKDEIKGLIVKGMTRAEVKRFVADKHADWEYTPRWVGELYNDCLAELSEEAPAIDRRREFTLAKLRNDLLYHSSVKMQDFKTALSANVQNIKLMRLDDPKFVMDWRATAESAGLDPDETMNQFMEMMKAQANPEPFRTIDDPAEMRETLGLADDEYLVGKVGDDTMYIVKREHDDENAND